MILEFLQSNPKARAVVDCPPQSFLAKDSNYSKLLNSLVYDYGKHMSAFCPVDDKTGDLVHKEFFPFVFHRFWAQFPNLEEAHQLSLSDKSTLSSSSASAGRRFGHYGSLKSCVRSTMNTRFVKFIRKAQGAIQCQGPPQGPP